jgi:hypothetical protein
MAEDLLPVNEMLTDAYEPKRQNRWLFQFDDDTIPTFIARSASKPSYTMDPIEIHYMNSRRYLAGKPSWGEITLGLYDPIAPSASQKVMEWIRLSHEFISGRAGYAAFYKKDFNLKSLDPVGAVVEDWEIQGSWVQGATFGDLSHDAAEPTEIEITIRMDNCILKF